MYNFCWFYILVAYVYKQVAETDHLSYVGTNYDPDSTALLATANCRYIIKQNSINAKFIVYRTLLLCILVCRYCIGALDRETGVMTLHKTQHFTLKPHIPGWIVWCGTGSSALPAC